MVALNKYTVSILGNFFVNRCRDTQHSTISVLTDPTNISVVDIGVNENMPVEAPEPWTTTMYVCLFVGGFWCGAMNDFLNGTRHPYVLGAKGIWRYRGVTTATMPFWAKWRSSRASQSNPTMPFIHVNCFICKYHLLICFISCRPFILLVCVILFRVFIRVTCPF